jgi:hypothetical protein
VLNSIIRFSTARVTKLRSSGMSEGNSLSSAGDTTTTSGGKSPVQSGLVVVSFGDIRALF